MSGLTMYESTLLRDTRNLMCKKPAEVLKYLKSAPENETYERAMVALALRAQLEMTKGMHESMKVTTALCEFLNIGKEKP